MEISIDDMVTVISYKKKTVQNFLTEIAGLLVFIRIFKFILSAFHESRFVSKMKKMTKEEFRQVFTYQTFKKLIIEN
jgi:hypothetical protein